MEPDNEALSEETFCIPEHILNQQILPLLPAKPLNCFKAVSKAYQAMISSDTYFLTLQSLSPSPTSTGFVYAEDSGLSFFPNQDIIGIPDPSLKFVVKYPEDVKLLCSTNGLLLFCLFGGQDSLCICNPATMKKEIVPTPEDDDIREMGLAFNPHLSPRRYVIIDPIIDDSIWDIEYSFNVFRSETGKWNLSKQTVCGAGSCNPPTKLLYAQGLLYWCCIDILLWFDPEKDCAGTIPLPYYNDPEKCKTGG